MCLIVKSLPSPPHPLPLPVVQPCELHQMRRRLSAAAFDDGLALAKAGEHLLSECMCVSGRVLAGRAAGGSGGGGQWWSEEAGHARLAEVLGRMRVNSDLAARLSTGVAAA